MSRKLILIAALVVLCNAGCGHPAAPVHSVALSQNIRPSTEDPCKTLTVPEMPGSPRLNSAWPIPRQLQALDCHYNRVGTNRRLGVVLEILANGVRDPRLTTHLAKELAIGRVDLVIGTIDLATLDRPEVLPVLLEMMPGLPLENGLKNLLVSIVQSSGKRLTTCNALLDKFAQQNRPNPREARLKAWYSFYSQAGDCFSQSLRRLCQEAFDVSDETDFSVSHLKESILNEACGLGQVRALPFFVTALKNFLELVTTGADAPRMLEVAAQLMRYRNRIDAVVWNQLIEASLLQWASPTTCSDALVQQIVTAWGALQIQDAPHASLARIFDSCATSE